MNHNVKKILGELKAGNEGAEKEYIGIYTDNIIDYASAVLTLNYYILYETGLEEKNYNVPSLVKYALDANDIIEKYVVNDEKVNTEVLERVNDMRNLIIKKVDLLLNYTAKLYIYEYILNRLEYNFEEPLENSKFMINDDNFAKQVVDYIFSNNDSMVINGKIREVVAQLPVRMTKDKFYGLISEAMTLYKGNKVEALDSFIEKIQGAATLTKDEYDEEYKLLIDTIEYYDGIDFKNIDEDTFRQAQEKYRQVNDFVRTYTDFLSDLQRSINMSYAIIYAKYIREQVQIEEVNVESTRKEIIEHLCSCFRSEYASEIDDNITSKLTSVEGIQEKSHTLIMQLEQGLDEEILALYAKNDNNIADIIVGLKKCSLLIDVSIFALMDSEVVDDRDVDDVILAEKTSLLISQFKELFASKSKMYTRAVISNILGELPVFFADMNEVVEYVHNQISSCRNENEKMACYAILTDMMADDDIKWDFNV